jgi:hypothetical protein
MSGTCPGHVPDMSGTCPGSGRPVAEIVRRESNLVRARHWSTSCKRDQPKFPHQPISCHVRVVKNKYPEFDTLSLSPQRTWRLSKDWKVKTKTRKQSWKLKNRKLTESRIFCTSINVYKNKLVFKKVFYVVYNSSAARAVCKRSEPCATDPRNLLAIRFARFFLSFALNFSESCSILMMLCSKFRKTSKVY